MAFVSAEVDHEGVNEGRVMIDRHEAVMNPQACGRMVLDGSGFTQVCGRKPGHTGYHESRWRDRNGVLQLGITWEHERYGAAILPEYAHKSDVEKVTTDA